MAMTMLLLLFIGVALTTPIKESLAFSPLSTQFSAETVRSTTTLSVSGGGFQDPSSFMIQEFIEVEQLETVVQLASKPLPERPDGIVCVAKYSSLACSETESQYERLARENPATLFLRSFKEFENSDALLGHADITVFPTHDIFYGGNRVARVTGNSLAELQSVLDQYQFQNSQLDLFSESADNERRVKWTEGKIQSGTSTPRTTGRFIPGYDWDKAGGFFDETADSLQEDWDKAYGDWTPNVDDD